MIWLVSHGFRKGGKNPSLIWDGLLPFQIHEESPVVLYLSDLVLKCKLILFGEGARFWETYLAMKSIPKLRSAIKKIETQPCQILGTVTSRTKHRDSRTYWVLFNNDFYPGKKRFTLGKLSVDWWEIFLKPLPDNTILFSGAEFMQDTLKIKEPCHSCSLWGLDVAEKQARCFISKGEIVH